MPELQHPERTPDELDVPHPAYLPHDYETLPVGFVAATPAEFFDPQAVPAGWEVSDDALGTLKLITKVA